MTPTTRGRRRRCFPELGAVGEGSSTNRHDRDRDSSNVSTGSTINGQRFSDLTPRSEHSLNVLGENIELEIHRIAHLDLVQISMGFRVRDNPHDEAFRKNFGDGKTDSIHRNRSLARDIMDERLW
jgi:hypothetical protein